MTFEDVVFVDAKLARQINKLLVPGFKKLWELVVEHDLIPPHRIRVTDARGVEFLFFTYELDNAGNAHQRNVKSKTQDFVPSLPVTINLDDSGPNSVKVTIEPYSASEFIQ